MMRSGKLTIIKEPWFAPFALLLVVYTPVLRDLIVNWATDSNYSHGFLVFPLSIVLLWKKRKSLAGSTQNTDSRGLFVLLLGMVFFVVGNAGAEYFVAGISFVISIIGLVWYLFGLDVMRLAWFELIFLFFMIPIPYVVYYYVAFPLQLTASTLTVGALHSLGISIARHGNILVLPDGISLEVAEACSGMRSLMSLLALGALYARYSQRRLLSQFALFLLTIPIALIANVFRVFVTVLISITVTRDVVLEPIHSIMNSLVFVVSLLLLLIVGSAMKMISR